MPAPTNSPDINVTKYAEVVSTAIHRIAVSRPTSKSRSALFFSVRIYWKRCTNIVATVIVAAIFVSAGVVAPLVYEGLAPHQKERIDTFLNPGSNPLGAGYNVMQSLMAVGSGGVSGKGFTQGTQTQLRYIPMQWTDFIYSVPSEEFGFVGGAIVIALHFGLIWRAIITASIVANKFYSIICIGAATIFFYHTTINIGMAIGIMPVMGIPLPFMSYGGTSLIMTMGLGGLILNAHRQHELKRSV